MKIEIWLDHTITGSNKHGKSAKDISFTDLVKILNMAETASGSNVQSKQCSEQAINMLQELNIAKQGMA